MIESLQNEKIKYLKKLLTDNRFRKKNEVFTIEGKQENTRAQKFGYDIVELYIAPEIYKDELPQTKTQEISAKIYNSLAYRSNSEGIIGIYKIKNDQLSTLQIDDHSTIIVIEGVEKPGNLGAILRSCEAFGVDAVVVTDTKVDFYNPNVIRSSVGCLFGMQICSADNNDLLIYLDKNQFQILTTVMSADSEDIYTKNLTYKTAFVFGTEHSGLTDFWKNKGENIIIPMAGTIDSLNLSNAVAIACYETLRQKKA